MKPKASSLDSDLSAERGEEFSYMENGKEKNFITEETTLMKEC